LQKVVLLEQKMLIWTFSLLHAQDVESDVAVASVHSVVGRVAPCPRPAVAS